MSVSILNSNTALLTRVLDEITARIIPKATVMVLAGFAQTKAQLIVPL